MPLSEEEQRILQEMEQKLREHDRDFVDRVSHSSHRLQTSRGAKWAVFAFVVGTALLLATFRSSLGLGICGILIMVVSALAFAQYLGIDESRTGAAGEAEARAESPDGRARPAARGLRSGRNTGIVDEWSEMRRRMRSRFGHRD